VRRGQERLSHVGHRSTGEGSPFQVIDFPLSQAPHDVLCTHAASGRGMEERNMAAASEDDNMVPCSLCPATFSDARDLGHHILREHCDTGNGNQEKTAKDEAPLERTQPPPPLPPPPPPPAAVLVQQPSQPAKIITLPRPLTDDERKQQFMVEKLADASTRYTCLLCQKVYTSRYNIRMHMNMHTGKNVHTCAYCGRYFAHKHVFESHVRTHTGEKPYACQKCGKAFGDRSNCTSHQKKCKNVRKVTEETVNTPATLVKASNNNTQPHHPPPPVEINTQEVRLDIKEEPIEEEDAISGPKILSVGSVHDSDDEYAINNNNVDHNYNGEDNLDVDAIVDDALYDEDLEEIQIEPDIIDYSDDDMMAMEEDDEAFQGEENGEGKGEEKCEEEDQTLDVPLPYACSFCGQRFPVQPQLISHLSQHITLPNQEQPQHHQPQVEEQRKFTCLTCGKVFGKQEQLSGHLKVHAMERRAQLRQEREQQPEQPQEQRQQQQPHQYKCRFCEKSFNSLNELDIHTKVHSSEYKFKCAYCEESFGNASVAQAHQRICSANTGQAKKPRVRRGRREDSKEQQQKQHPNYVPDNNSNNVIPPDEIDPPASAEERRAGYCHRKLLDGRRRIVCVDCGKHYTTMYNMRQHRNIHTGKNLYACRHCGKEFTHKHVWETHERIHTGERPFKCEHCDKAFADRSNYNSHRKLCAATVKSNTQQQPQHQIVLPIVKIRN